MAEKEDLNTVSVLPMIGVDEHLGKWQNKWIYGNPLSHSGSSLRPRQRLPMVKGQKSWEKSLPTTPRCRHAAQGSKTKRHWLYAFTKHAAAALQGWKWDRHTSPEAQKARNRLDSEKTSSSHPESWQRGRNARRFQSCSSTQIPGSAEGKALSPLSSNHLKPVVNWHPNACWING